MRVVGGDWRGRRLYAPPGSRTRPTADRVRQALFDMLMHAGWGGRSVIDGASVLDTFAGTGALGLEALSRGAAMAYFIESDAAALRALRANVAACKAEDRSEILPVDVLSAFGARRWSGTQLVGTAPLISLVFLDPPYGQDLVPRALTKVRGAGLIRADALCVAEIGRDETWKPDEPLLDERALGPARILIFRAG